VDVSGLPVGEKPPQRKSVNDVKTRAWRALEVKQSAKKVKKKKIPEKVRRSRFIRGKR